MITRRTALKSLIALPLLPALCVGAQDVPVIEYVKPYEFPLTLIEHLMAEAVVHVTAELPRPCIVGQTVTLLTGTDGQPASYSHHLTVQTEHGLQWQEIS